MAEQYQVDYLINVKSDAAVTAINNFKTAVAGLMGVKDDLDKFEKMLRSKMDVFKEFNMTMKPKIETRDVEYKIDRLIKKMQTLHGLTNNTLGTITAPPNTGENTVISTTQAQTRNRTQAARNNTTSGSSKRPLSSVTSYRIFGPSMLDSGGVTAVDLMKGMGMAYGISGLGTMIGQAIAESVDYDNIMQTTKNILASHDREVGFADRFANMERRVRDVGVKTKFTSAEVAGASKFLAMAGFNVKDINQSIAPIANIALVGDTEIGETADLVTNIMTGYGITAEKIRNASDVMTMTFTKSNTTLTEIAEAYKYSASLLHAGDVPFEIATAALGILGDAGIKGSQAGTTMRTIMSNIVFPRGKKGEKWEEIGVSRYDSNGNVRPLLDIFKDLKSKDLSLDDYYGIFDKTAAQGAVSLVNAVDKWNEIVELNFLSSGITDKLAKEKQNTVAGLWAQLTSAFIENGLKTFEALETPIKNLLIDTTKWLSSQEALDMLTMFGTTLIDLLKTLKDIALTIVKLYQEFKPVVDLWVKFQVAALPFLAAGRAVKGLSTMVMWVTKLALGLRIVYKTLGGLNNLAAQGTLKKYLGSLINLAPFTESVSGVGGKTFNNPIMAAVYKERFHGYNEEWKDQILARYNARYNKRLTLGIVGSGIGTALGSATGGMLGTELTDGSAIGGFLGTLIGGGVGSIGSSLLLSKLGAASAFTSLPFGIVAFAAATIIGLGAAIYNTDKKITESIETLDKYIASTKKINGIDYSETASNADKYYQIIYNKQLDVNEALSEHIKLLRERAGLESNNTQPQPNVTFKDLYPDAYNTITNASGTGDGWWNKTKYWFMNLFNGQSDKLLNQAFYDSKGKLHGVDLTYVQQLGKIYNKETGEWEEGYMIDPKTGKGIVVANGMNFHKRDEVAAQWKIAEFFTSLGQKTEPGTLAGNLISEYEQRFLRAQSIEDIQAIQKDLHSRLEGLPIDPNSAYINQHQLQNLTSDQIDTNFHLVTEAKNVVKEHFEGKDSPFQQILSAYANILKDIKNLGYVDIKTASKFAYLSGVHAFDPRLGEFGSPEYMARFGFKNNQWGPIDIGKNSYGAAEAQQNFLLNKDELIKIVGNMAAAVQPYMSIITNHPAWSAGEKNTNPAEGAIASLNNKQYKFELRSPSMFPMWYPVDGKGNPLSNKTLQDEIHKKATLQNIGVDNNNETSTGGANKTTSYASPYKSTSPAPKQVIVRIENLMNVESIDLSNKENETVIDNIKSQLAQALIDVVHDFDNSYHG